MNKISNQAPKGTADWLPEEFKIRKYIFDAWRRVCLRFGYEEYMTPIVEKAEIYRAKSGGDVGGKELITFKDQGGRELSIRPEMTPSVTRMVSKIYRIAPKPIRLFSIANFIRNEKPQRGRNREFWQLNCDIFGNDSINADIEMVQIALEIMLEFNPPKNSFVIYVNNRKIIDELLNKVVKVEKEKIVEVVRAMDKYEKISNDSFKKILKDMGLDEKQILVIEKYITSKEVGELVEKIPELKSSEGIKETDVLIKSLIALGYSGLIKFNPSIIRGFDYYDGIVYEVFDKNIENTRAMFGGGRYNGLASIFGVKDFGAVGIAPGDETFRIFLESWGMIDNIEDTIKNDVYYLPILSDNLIKDAQNLANVLRQDGKNVEMGLEVQKLKKALSYVDKKSIQNIIVFGEDEREKGIYKIRNMKSKKEEEIKIN